MDNRTKEYGTAGMDSLMISIPEGEEIIRTFRDDQKWLSSDSRMSIPGKKGNLEKREERVVTDAFFLARIPVTEPFYRAVLDGTPGGMAQYGLPVVNVSWLDAIRFCNMLSVQCGLSVCYVEDSDGSNVRWDRMATGYRLPTDAEWQYACRAGTAGYRYGELDEIGWYRGNSSGRVHPAGEKSPNPWLLSDMLGNVWEWCWDLYDEATYGPYRVFRGGSWAESARGCGATSRRRGHPAFRIDDLGFRLARTTSSP